MSWWVLRMDAWTATRDLGWIIAFFSSKQKGWRSGPKTNSPSDWSRIGRNRFRLAFWCFFKNSGTCLWWFITCSISVQDIWAPTLSKKLECFLKSTGEAEGRFKPRAPKGMNLVWSCKLNQLEVLGESPSPFFCLKKVPIISTEIVERWAD